MNTASTTDHCEIAIIGGGMVGTSLAAMLASALPQVRIVLIEAAPLAREGAIYQPSFDARSTALAEGSADILQTLGLWQELQQHITAIERVHVSDKGYFPGGEISAAQQQGTAQQQRHAVGYVVENAWLGRVLLNHVLHTPSIQCLAPARVTQLLPKANGALLHIAQGDGTTKQLHAQLAVIADGGDSPLRQALGIHTQVREYQQSAIIANVEFSEPHQGTAYERFTEQGPIALLPLGESAQARQAALVWTLPSEQAAATMALDEGAFLQQLQSRFGFRNGYFTRVSKRFSYSLQLQLAEEQVRSHVVLLGNAAHFLHPVAGQGFNLALRDCAALVETLRYAAQQQQPLGALAVLQRYLARQAQDQQLTVEFSDKLVRLFSSQRLPLVTLRHLGLLSLEVLSPLKQMFGQQTMGRAGRQYRWRELASDAQAAHTTTANTATPQNTLSKPAPSSTPDMVIVGAGIVGAALAIAVAQAVPQWRIAVIEAGQEAAHYTGEHFDPRVVALTQASQQLLSDIGIWQAVAGERACAYSTMQVWDGEGTASIHFDAADSHQEQLGHIVENSVIVRALHQRMAQFANIQLHQPVAIGQLTQHSDNRIDVPLSDGTLLQTALLIAADGARSGVREQAGFTTREWDYGHTAIVTSVQCEKPHEFTAWQRFMHTGPLAFLPLQRATNAAATEHHCSIVWSAKDELAQQLMAMSDGEFCQALGRAFEYRLGDIQHAAPRFAIALRQRHARDYVRPGIALVGDAAHNIHPLAGQGVNLGLLDVRALCTELTRAHQRQLNSGDYSILRRYQRQRLGDNLGMMAAMEGFKQLFGSENIGVNWLRNSGLRWCDEQSLLKKWLTQTALGVKR